MTFYVQQQHHFIANELDDKTLRQQLKEYGIDGRRLSRFTLLALLGALPLKPLIDPATSIYLGSPFNSPSKFDKMFTQLMTQNLPSPLDFMANINNAATFQLAQTLETTGNSVFLAINEKTCWQPLQLAQLDLMGNDTNQALVGWVRETNNGQTEGACFWLLSKDPQNAIKEWDKLPQINDHQEKDFLLMIQSIV